MLKSHGDAYQSIADSRRNTRFLRDTAMRGTRRMGDGALGIAQISRNRNHPGGINQAPGGFLTTFNVKRYNRSTALLLFHRQRVLRVRLQPRIIDARYTRLLLQPLRQFQSIARMCLHAYMQGLQPLEEYPGIESTHGRPRSAQEAINRFQQVFLTQYRAAQATPLPVNIFGGGVNDDI